MRTPKYVTYVSRRKARKSRERLQRELDEKRIDAPLYKRYKDIDVLRYDDLVIS